MDKEFEEKVIAARGQAGRKILENIPRVIEKYEKEWGIQVAFPYKLSYNYVAPAKDSEGKKVVFKIGIWGHDEFMPEYAALQVFNGDGIAKILQANVSDDVMLLECVNPGVPLSQLDDDELATRVVASIINKLHKPVPSHTSFPTLDDWFKGFSRLEKKFNGTTGPMPENIIQEGKELYQYLLDTTMDIVLLHGDLHHENILSSEREDWLAIDPDAVIGDPVHETAAMLRNPQSKIQSDSHLQDTLQRRIEILSEDLSFDPERIRQWGIAQNVLSAIWKIEDEGKDWQSSLRIAEVLVRI